MLTVKGRLQLALILFASIAWRTVAAEEQVACSCTKDFQPVCSIDSKTYNNACLAACAKKLIAYPGACKEECRQCPPLWSPLCSAQDPDKATKGQTFGSDCFARCNGLDPANLMLGNCKMIAGCACTMQFDPWCGADGKTYSNPSCARCAEVPVLYPGDCLAKAQAAQQQPPQDDTPPDAVLPPPTGSSNNPGSNGNTQPPAGSSAVMYQPPLSPVRVRVSRPPPPELSRQPPSCDTCDSQAAPVCGVDGNTYVNECRARCAGTKVLSEGPCGSAQDACNKCIPTKDIWDPVCLITKGKDGSTSTRTYANPCYASCLGGAASSAKLYQGACNAKCDAACAKAALSLQCCGTGAEYPSKCYAACLGNLSTAALKRCSRGHCKGEKAANMLRRCSPPGAAKANCLRDPCQNATCKDASGAKCVPSYCPKFYRLQYLDAVCAPLWLNASTGGLITDDCNSSSGNGTTQCAARGESCRLTAPAVLAPIENGKACCAGLVCYAGPLERPGQVYGTCYPKEGPFPIG